ncbi:MAG TPA: NAD-dependent epimerase/dehydratase family protein [Polyangiaceae bacterium]|nr:NAD-dependent epimerase/dehydratase family protein [Polyangiaceae bacterium]
MRVLVTGGTGFLVGHVAEALSARGDDVRALVRKTSNTKHLKGVPRVELFEGSVEQVDRVTEAVDGVDAIVHCAGIVKARSADEFFAVNVGGTSNLVEAARKRGGALKRFVQVSSLEACGPSADGAPVPLDQENPVTSYGRSKLAAEKVVLSAKDAMPVVILRPAGIYGPRDVEVLDLMKSVQRGLFPVINGGRSKGVWIYASDCAESCVRAIDADVPSGRTYFVDDGCGAIDASTMFADFEKAIGRRALRARLPMPVFLGVARGVEAFGRLTNRPVMLTREKANMLVQDWVCSSESTRKDLGWQPKVPWSEGVPKAVAWYREKGWL